MTSFIKNTEKIANWARLTEICDQIDNKSYSKLNPTEHQFIDDAISKLNKKEANAFLMEYLTGNYSTNYSYGHVKPENDALIFQKICEHHKIDYLDKALQDSGQDTYSNVLEYLGGQLLSYNYNNRNCSYAVNMCSAIFDKAPSYEFSTTVVDLLFSEENTEGRLLDLIGGDDGIYDIRSSKKGRITIEKLPPYIQNILSVLTEQQLAQLTLFMIKNNENYFNELDDCFNHPVCKTYQKTLNLGDMEFQGKLLAQLLNSTFITNISLEYKWGEKDYASRLATMNALFEHNTTRMLEENPECLKTYLKTLSANLILEEQQSNLKQITFDAVDSLFKNLNNISPSFAQKQKDYLYSISCEHIAKDPDEEQMIYFEKLKIMLVLNNPSSNQLHKTLKI